MKLSVIVPCFNVDRFLEEALDSVCGQTFKELEILCIDDGSTDRTPEILANFERKDGRIRVISKLNTGYGDSVNLGIEEASGDYLAIFEPDDFIEKDMYEILMMNAESMGLDVSRCIYFDYLNGVDKLNRCKKLIKNRIYRPRNSSDILVFQHAPSIWAAVYRKEWLDQKGIRLLPTGGASFQDTSFAFKTNLLAERCYAVDKPLYHYRSHPNNSVKSVDKVYAIMDEYQECIAFARKHGYLDIAKSVLLEMEYSNYIWNYRRMSAVYREDFLQHWRKEWRKLMAEGFCFQRSKHRFHAWLLIYFPFFFRSYLNNKVRNG